MRYLIFILLFVGCSNFSKTEGNNMYKDSYYWINCAITVPYSVEECHLQKVENYLCRNHGGVVGRNLGAYPDPELKCADGKTFPWASWCFKYSEDECEKE